MEARCAEEECSFVLFYRENERTNKREDRVFHPSNSIGKMDGWKHPLHPSPRGGVRYRCFITKFTNSHIHTFTGGGGCVNSVKN